MMVAWGKYENVRAKACQRVMFLMLSEHLEAVPQVWVILSKIVLKSKKNLAKIIENEKEQSSSPVKS